MNTKQMKRLKPQDARLKEWAREQTTEVGEVGEAARMWCLRKGLVLLLALLAFPMLGAPEECGNQAVPLDEVQDALPEIPWQGCDEPQVLHPGPLEDGNWISLRRGHTDRTVSKLWIDHRNWGGKLGSPPRTLGTCAPHELVISVFRANSLVSPMEVITIADPAWNLLEIPFTRTSGEIWVNVEFRYDVGTGTHTCIGTCRDTQVTERGDYFWCRRDPSETLGQKCYDMVDGGDSPMPGFIAYAPMIWTDACYSSRTC